MQKYKIMNTKTVFLVCFLLTFFNIALFGQAKDKVAKVVIDAGHGGNDPGSLGKICKEKDINLKVALRFGELISTHFDDVTIVYTRKKDETVELYKRAEIANKSKADLFISIHCNAVENRSVTGVETFVMGVEKSAESIAIAKKENAAILLEKDYKTNYDFDPNSPEAYIVFSLYSSAYLNWSTLLASRVQNHLLNNTKMVDRTVKQARFFVLYKVAMPSILVELGFISNAEEEKYLIKEDTQELLAISLYNAFVEYKNLLEGTEKPYLSVPNVGKPKPKIEPKEVTKTDSLAQTVETDTTNLNSVNTETTKIDTATTIATTPLVAEKNIRFRIQFFISKENLSVSNKKFASIPEVKKYNENKLWKYTSGDYKTLDEAQNKLKDVKRYFSDAFVIAFNNEQKISIAEAQVLLK
jgi:N-acetylmuramoyl-L-alanine amidase